MKRRKLIRHFIREGGKHTIYYNPSNNRTSAIPRHSEIVDILVKKFLKNLKFNITIQHKSLTNIV